MLLSSIRPRRNLNLGPEFMMYDPAPRRGPATSEERWIYGIFMVVFFGLLVGEVFHDFSPVKLSGLLVFLFWMPLVALHEAGHAVVATLVGWNVGRVVIGVGRTLGSFRLGSAVVEIHTLPVEGFVSCVPRNLHLPRLKSALIYFAGPGVELLLSLVILLIVRPDRLFSRSDDYVIIVCQSLAIAATFQAVVNLIPHAIVRPEGSIANDGLGIIRSFLRPESDFANMIGRTYNRREREWQEHDPADWWKR